MKTQAHFEKELQSLIEFSKSHLLKQQVDIEIVTRLMRVLEIQVHGEAKTPLPTRHHA